MAKYLKTSFNKSLNSFLIDLLILILILNLLLWRHKQYKEILGFTEQKQKSMLNFELFHFTKSTLSILKIY